MDRFRYFADERGTNVALRVNVPFFIPEKVKQKWEMKGERWNRICHHSIKTADHPLAPSFSR